MCAQAGTIGGSVANNDPNADYPAACLGLGATIITSKRKIPADEFFTGMFSTALAPDEIITKISFPIAKKAAYQKFKHPASGFALVGVFVSKRGSDIRVAVTGAGANGVFRVKEFEEALKKRFSPKSLEGLSVKPDGLNSDIHAGAEYRAHLIGVLARRAVADAVRALSRRLFQLGQQIAQVERLGLHGDVAIRRRTAIARAGGRDKARRRSRSGSRR